MSDADNLPTLPAPAGLGVDEVMALAGKIATAYYELNLPGHHGQIEAGLRTWDQACESLRTAISTITADRDAQRAWADAAVIRGKHFEMMCRPLPVPYEHPNAMSEQAEAWMRVARALKKVSPNWHELSSQGGTSAILAIEQLGAKLEAAEAKVASLEADAGQLREVMKVVRFYPDFNNGEGPLVEMMDQAIEGKPVPRLVAIAYLSQGLRPPADAAIDAAMKDQKP